MFKKKVGSDACLVLDAVVTLASTTATFTLSQKFDYEDVLEASKTRAVVVRCTTSNATLSAAFGDCNIAPVVAFDSTNKRIYITGNALLGTKGTLFMSQDSTTKVWSGTYSIA